MGMDTNMVRSDSVAAGGSLPHKQPDAQPEVQHALQLEPEPASRPGTQAEAQPAGVASSPEGGQAPKGDLLSNGVSVVQLCLWAGKLGESVCVWEGGPHR